MSIIPNENIVIYPTTWGLSDEHKMQNIIDECGYNSKTVYIFFITDCCDSFSIPNNVKVYRTSLLKSQKIKTNLYCHIYGKDLMHLNR
jgi:hypothetical protein